VAGLCPRRVIRPHLMVRTAEFAIPAALVMGLRGGVAGAQPDAIRVHRAVCHRSPQFITIHSLGPSRDYRGERRALDCMIPDSTVGWNIANWTRVNVKKLGVSEVIIGVTSGLCSEARRPVVRMSTLGSTDCKSHGSRACPDLRQQRSTLVEDSKQSLYDRFFTGGGWT
jgi:hypothetical protein